MSEKAKVAHLLRRFGLGASEAEMDYYGANGYQGAIKKLLDYEDTDEGFGVDPSLFANKDSGNVPMPGMQLWWYLRLLATRHPFEQKMTLFWHDHFATSGAKVDIAEAMYRHIEVLRTNAVGPFGTLLTEISKDPAMLYWLDNNENIKQTPNENFAREVMELFTLGVDNVYTEKDIQEAARALTGWTFGVRRAGRSFPTPRPGRNARFAFVPERHDDGVKTVLGQSGNLDGDDVLTILVGEMETAKYITKKIWEWFVYDDPSDALIDKLASDWQGKGLETKELVRAIVNTPEFFSDRAVRKVIKNPIDFCVSTMRALGFGEIVMQRIRSSDAENGRRLAAPVGVLLQKTTSMGMELLFPPDVSGWVRGDEWISTATMVERIRFADLLFGPLSRGVIQLIAQNLPSGTEPSKGIVDKLVSVFDADLPPAKMKTLYDAAESASGGRVTPQNVQPVMLSVTRLIFGSPEFQFC